MAEKSTGIIILLIAAVVVILWTQGVFNGIGNSNPNPDTKNLAPSDLKTTITLNTKDILATTPTDANVSYYIFKSSDGSLYKEGTTSAGTTSFDVQYGQNYKVLAYKDATAAGGATDYLPYETSFLADDTEGSIKTVNVGLKKEGQMVISSARDPVDLDSNISAGLGSTSSWQVLWKVNVSNAAIMDPILVIDTNQSTVKTVSITDSSWSSITCPKRLTSNTGRTKYCFANSNVFSSAQGTQTISGTVEFDATTATTAIDNLAFEMADQTEYKEANYVTSGYSAFHVGAEDTSRANIGAPDSATVNLYLGG